MKYYEQTSGICTTAEMIARLKDKNKYLTMEMLEQTEKLKKNINVLHKELEQVKEENRKLNLLVEKITTSKKKISEIFGQVC